MTQERAFAIMVWIMNRWLAVLFFLAFGACWFGFSATSVSAANCAVNQPTWSCQTVDPNDPRVASQCVSSQLCQGNNIACCAPGTGQQPQQAQQPTPTPVGGTSGGGGAAVGFIPSQCLNTGNCTLKDIVVTAVNFVNFLFGLSGAIFLAIFVYAGFLYIWSAVDDQIKKAKTMLVQSTIGIIIMFGAHAIVKFVVKIFLG